MSLPVQSLCANAGAPVYEIGSRCLPWEHQAALVLEFARSREVDVAALLADSQLQPGGLLSPQQLLSLLAALQRELPAPDTPFVLGQLSLPGPMGLASQALSQAGSLHEALHTLVSYAARLSPLLTPRLLQHGDELILLWTAACGVGAAQRGFVVDMQMSALTSVCNWLGGARLPWRYSFNRTRPRDASQHAVFLGHQLQFDCHVDAMRLPTSHLHRPWRQVAAAQPGSFASQALEQGADAGARGRGLLAALYDHLLPRYREAPALDEVAQAFGMSSATLKRRLALHGTHYQAELDQVRTHVALYLLLLQGRSNEAVATELGFHDRNNFRRSFKRWTGLAPSLVG